MKSLRKMISLFSALCILASLAAPAFAAEAIAVDPDYHPEVWLGTLPDEAAPSAQGGESDMGCQMPYNPGTGTTGIEIFSFVAESESLQFKIDWVQADMMDTYHYVLWQVDGNGMPDSVVEGMRECSFGAWQGYDNLVVGSAYYLVASSMDVPPTGAACTYTYQN